MKPSCARTLARLQATPAQWVRGIDLAAPDCGGLRFGGRIFELRALGYRIQRRSDPHSAVDQYRLIEKPEQLTWEAA